MTIATTYPRVSFPEPGTVLYPIRRLLTPLSGHQEKTFMQQLKLWLPETIRICDDVMIVVSEQMPPYSPDLALFVEGHPEVRIDIEIDEPYIASGRKPIHYASCGDMYRDQLLNRHGWTVVRLAIRQVREDAKGCADYLTAVIAHLTEGAEMVKAELREVPLWGRTDSLKAAHYKTEEGETRQRDNSRYSFNAEERRCQMLVKPFARTEDMQQKMQTFRDAGRYTQDSHIDFEPEEHIYILDGRERLLPVSSLIAHFFEQFDALSTAERLCLQKHTDVGKTLDDWDRKGRIASEVGTYVHAQTENYFQNGQFDTTYTFTFNGTTEKIGVEKEKAQFLKFVGDYHIQPYRQEWPIYDSELHIAGTIDLVCQNADGSFTIYDWKRSSKVTNKAGEPIIDAFGKKTGLHGVKLPDTSYYHYCIQQNLYRYILQKNYGVKVNALNLVVLCPEYPTYYVVAVPLMDGTIDHIVQTCLKEDLGHLLQY